MTVPASYPMTLNAVRTGCNQTSNRDPVVDYDQQTVERTARALKDRRAAARSCGPTVGRRTLKYHQTPRRAARTSTDGRAGAAHGAAAARRAGAGRAEDPHRAAARVRRPRRGRGVPGPAWPPGPSRWCASSAAAGQQDRRWVHLLGPVAGGRRRRRPRAVDRDAVLAAGRRGARRPGAWRRTTRWPRPTPTTLVDELRRRCRSSAGCSTGWPTHGRRRPGGRGRLGPGPRHGVPGRGWRRRHRDRPLARRWSRRPGAASRTAATRSATCAG